MIKKFITKALLVSLCLPMFGMKQVIKQNKKDVLTYVQQLYNNVPITSESMLIGAGTIGAMYLGYLSYQYYQETTEYEKQRTRDMQNIFQMLKKLKLYQEQPPVSLTKFEQLPPVKTP